MTSFTDLVAVIMEHLLGGDDIVIIPAAPVDEPDPEIYASDPWDFYDEIRYPGASGRYEIEKVVVTSSDGNDPRGLLSCWAQTVRWNTQPYDASASLGPNQLIAVRVKDQY